jgi:GNAT superfamily N-acetyltransferase
MIGMRSASPLGWKAEAVLDRRRCSSQPELRPAIDADLGSVNAVIERAVMTWKLPERVKRLAMPSYCYTGYDLKYQQVVVAEDRANGVVGVAAWEAAVERDCPQGRRGLLLHGIYVSPDQQRRGIGSRLLSAVAMAARAQGCDGVLVKAQADAVGFFGSKGLQRLPVLHPDRDYPHRYWLDLTVVN